MANINQLTFDDIVSECLFAIYKEDFLDNELYLKGGQALRLVNKDNKRLSVDIDFSVPMNIEKNDIDVLEQILYEHFDGIGLHLFDFKVTKRPKTSNENSFPEWWKGFAVEFKLIDSKNKTFSIEEKRRSALKPFGAQGSSKIEIDISPSEYCGSYEEYEVKGSVVKVYSRELIIMEKLRALCQQHSDYIYDSKKKRARDYYDISTQLEFYVGLDQTKKLFEVIESHIRNVFDAKKVPLDILLKITENDFVENQRLNWKEVKETISGEKDFDVHVQRVNGLIKQIEKKGIIK